MRRVKILEWFQGKKVDSDREGLFHQWINSYDRVGEKERASANAIVEFDDGSVEEISRELIMFIDPPPDDRIRISGDPGARFTSEEVMRIAKEAFDEAKE